jgi:hypothetical protein
MGDPWWDLRDFLGFRDHAAGSATVVSLQTELSTAEGFTARGHALMSEKRPAHLFFAGD